MFEALFSDQFDSCKFQANRDMMKTCKCSCVAVTRLFKIKSLKVDVKISMRLKKLLQICDSQIGPAQLQGEETVGHRAPDVSFL